MMRKFALILLLAGTAFPSMANAQMQRGPRGDDNNPRSERSERVERPQRAERSTGSENRQRNMEVRRERAEPVARSSNERPSGVFGSQMRERIEARQQAQIQAQAAARTRAEASGSDRQRERGEWNGRRDRNGDNRSWQPREREVRTIPGTQPGTVTRDHNRDGRYDRNRSGTTVRHWDGQRWGRDWRNDRRYDWRRHRDRNRTTFRLGFYFDPFGYSYRRYHIGSYMYPGYYQSNYWLDDPWQYRLPPAYGPYRWVRYHNDALLIDTWSGQVVDVIYGFFW